MRRLLVLCYFYPPLAGGGVHRVLGFTRHLPRHGWQCTVVCAGATDYWVRDESLLAQVPEGVEVIRVGGGSALSTWLGLTRGARGRRSSRTFAGLRRLSDWWLLPDSYAGWSRRARCTGASGCRGWPTSAIRGSGSTSAIRRARGIARGTQRSSARCWRARTSCSPPRAPTPRGSGADRAPGRAGWYTCPMASR